MAQFRFYKVPTLYQSSGIAGDDDDKLGFIKKCALDLIEHNKNFQPIYYSITKSKDISTNHGPMFLWSLSSDLVDPDLDIVGCFAINMMLLFYKDNTFYCNARTNHKQIDSPALWRLDHDNIQKHNKIIKLDGSDGTKEMVYRIRTTSSSYLAAVFKLD